MQREWYFERNPIAVELVKLIHERNFAFSEDLVRITGRPRATVHYHLAKLDEGRYIQRRKFRRLSQQYVCAIGNKGARFLKKRLYERYGSVSTGTDYTTRMREATEGTVQHDAYTSRLHAGLALSSRKKAVPITFGIDVIDGLARDILKGRGEVGLGPRDIFWFDSPEEDGADLYNTADELFQVGENEPHLLVLEADLFSERGRSGKGRNTPKTISRKINVYYNAFKQGFFESHLAHPKVTILFVIETGYSGELRRHNFIDIYEEITAGSKPNLFLFATDQEFMASFNEGEVLTTPFLNGESERISILDLVGE